MTTLEEFNSIVDRIPAIGWSNYAVFKNTVDHTCWRYIYPNLNDSDHLAFVTRSKGDTGVFEVFVNDFVPNDLRKSLELHEFGHIAFTHLNLRKEQESIGINKIKSFWPQIKQYFENENPSDALFKKIYNSLINIAMDFEVNSKAFAEPEYPWAILYGNLAYACVVLKTKPEDNEEYIKVSEWLDKISSLAGNINFEDENYPEPIVPFCWPKDSGFPNKLSFTQYLDLMLIEHSKFFEYMDKMRAGGDGESNGESNEASNGKGMKPLTEEDIDEINKMFQDSNEDANNEDIEEVEEKEVDERETQERYDSLNAGKEYAFEKVDDSQLEKFLLDNCFNKSIKDCRVDYLRNYNRQKTGGDIFISRFQEEELWLPGNIYLVVDCSGSISDVIIHKVVTVAKNVASRCGKKSRIIWWDEECRGDFLLSDDKGPANYGGYTVLSSSIKYIKDNYILRDNDKIIIISDYLDIGLKDWVKELDSIKNDTIGICWDDSNDSCTETGDKMLSRVLCRHGVHSETISTLLKRVPTKFIKV